MVLNGARQVGKTYLLKEFGQDYFQNIVYVNLEINRQVRTYFEENLEPKKILQFLEVFAEERILPEKTLIILDEIPILCCGSRNFKEAFQHAHIERLAEAPGAGKQVHFPQLCNRSAMNIVLSA